jgi:hypothetical protein
MFCLFTHQAKIQICCTVKLISWNVVNLSHLYHFYLFSSKTWSFVTKIFEITRTIYSNSERSEQFFVTECFLCPRYPHSGFYIHLCPFVRSFVRSFVPNLNFNKFQKKLQIDMNKRYLYKYKVSHRHLIEIEFHKILIGILQIL